MLIAHYDYFRAYNRVLRGFADFSLHFRPRDLFALLGGSLRPLWLPLSDGDRPCDNRGIVDTLWHYDNVRMGLYFQVKHMLLLSGGYVSANIL